MIKQIEISILPKNLYDYELLKNAAAKKLKVSVNDISAVQIIRRSIDARKKPVYRLRVNVYINEEPQELYRKKEYCSVEDKRRVIIVGSGPAGLFAALKLIELGIKPVVLERGKDVRARRFDLKSLQQEHIVNPDSNYCFGEGGAGTYSDGKLYTRSLKHGNVKEILGDAVLLATGHSARDIYYMLNSKNIKLEAKSFAMGVRIEHPQQLIDSIQYHAEIRPENLPAATYNLSCQVDDRGVYSFCMCPGGIIVPASTAPGELVLNGMSVSRRDSPYANAGLVISVNESDWAEFGNHGVFAGFELQKKVERIAFDVGGGNQTAPAQRVTDFADGKLSASLPNSSYIPGTVSAPLHEILPKFIVKRLQRSLKIFGKRMHGYLTDEAQILAAETRTSSPVRIPRDTETLMHIEIAGLFPSGEGAGYAGGIVSAAIDGRRCTLGIAKYLKI